MLRFMARGGFLGIISAFSFAPFNWFPIFLITFSWLFVRISEVQEIKSLLIESFSFFFFWHVGCLYWLVYPLTLNLSKHWMLIPIAIMIIPAYLSLYLLIPVYITKKIFRQPSPIIFALSFCLIMLFYGNFLPGFPWVLPGYIWCIHEVFLQTLSIYGIYGLSFVTMLISGFGGMAFVCHQSGNKRDFKKYATFSGSLFLFIVSFGSYRLSVNKTEFTDKKIRIVQGNILHEKKQDHSLNFQNLTTHLNLSQHNSPVDFIVWPEASIPYLYKEDFTQLHDYLKSPLSYGEHLLAGAVRRDLSSGNVYNSVVAINHYGNNVANYDKSRLLPFGEYIPFRKYLPFPSIASDIGDFDVGNGINVFDINGTKIIFAICYEIVFPDRFSGIKNADLIINVTNDGWFGFTTEPFQHLQISRARAIETGLPLVRAVNYGISAVFDPYGREIARIPIEQPGVVEINIPKPHH